ncbi:type II secretion system protein [Hydrogenophaga sp. BPS33]|uniref:type II secretion system protein n=1 Tax=Hydrogenophaga sp. BPS33 TaxID=2651974 RepID=UPI00131FBAC8|nr:type II secretion system protein [Hydrogenophaga sp. BPS33]QHE86654.1 type II secretion system protein [Hydrogenophaga sp. BPS33]
MSSRSEQGGFTLVVALAALFMVALATQQVMAVVSQQAQREREAALLRIGAAYVAAIGAYHERSPGSVKRWPPSLDALTDDKRFVNLQRHLRKAYADPITRGGEWGLVPAPDGGVAGIFSRSDLAPIRSAGAALDALGLARAERYSDWKFVYQPAPQPAPDSAR